MHLATTAFLLNQLGKNVVPLHKAELFPSFEDGITPPEEVTHARPCNGHMAIVQDKATLSRFSLFHIRSIPRT